MSVFTDAIKVLEERGWQQGQYLDHDTGQVCLVGAMGFAQGGAYDQWDTKALALLHFVIGGTQEWDDVESFNDEPSTTYEDVVLALKRAHELVETSL